LYGNGNVYVGDFYEGKKHGTGDFKKMSQLQWYQGHIENGLYNGLGKLVLYNSLHPQDPKCIIQGYFVNGKTHGECTIFCLDIGCVFQGTVLDGVRKHGKYIFANQWVYEGEFVDGKMTNTTTNAKFYNIQKDLTKFPEYEGKFQDGVIVQGKMSFQDHVYFGTFNALKQPHGQGRIHYDSTGISYYGEFRDGLHDGFGVMRFKNGDTYTGNFQHGCLHGKGTYVFASSVPSLSSFSSTSRKYHIKPYTGVWEQNKNDEFLQYRLKYQRILRCSPKTLNVNRICENVNKRLKPFLTMLTKKQHLRLHQQQQHHYFL
jgi:hypothetical protein